MELNYNHFIYFTSSNTLQVKAVDYPELRAYTDVVVFPIKGSYSLASFLGGGE